MTNQIEKAVAPLKEIAKQRATQLATKTIAKVKKELEENDMDASIIAPFPSSMNISRADYREQKEKYDFVRRITDNVHVSRSMNDPDTRSFNTERENKMIQIFEEKAIASYDAYVNKLNTKIGEVKSAELSGENLWEYSFLTVETKDGEVQTWKTQMIMNVSKLGTLFNQWPTRKVKK